MINNIHFGEKIITRLYSGSNLIWGRPPVFSPKTLFSENQQGVWYDPSDKSTLYQDVAGTVPVTSDGDPVALMKDKSGNGLHARQTLSAYRPIYRIDAQGKSCLESSAGGYMLISSPFDFLVDKTGATLVMAFGKFVDDIACVIGNDSVRRARHGFDIYLDNRSSTNPLIYNHTNPNDGVTNSTGLANMVSNTQPFVINYKQDRSQNFWGSTVGNRYLKTYAAGTPNGHNMAILGADGVEGVKFTTKTPDFYGMVIVNEAIPDFAEINNYMLDKTGGV